MLTGHTQVISDSPRQLGLRVNWCMLGGLIEKCTHMPTFSNSFKKDEPNKKENSSLMFVNSPQFFFSKIHRVNKIYKSLPQDIIDLFFKALKIF